MVSIKVGVRHTVRDNQFCFSISEVLNTLRRAVPPSTISKYVQRKNERDTETYMMYCSYDMADTLDSETNRGLINERRRRIL